MRAFLMMASRPIVLPLDSGAGWLRTLTGPKTDVTVVVLKKQECVKCYLARFP